MQSIWLSAFSFIIFVGGIGLSLQSDEPTYEKARHRLPPVIFSLDLPHVVETGGSYDFSWSVMGYHDTYDIKIQVFDNSGDLIASDTVSPHEEGTGKYKWGSIRSREFFYETRLRLDFLEDQELTIRFYASPVNDPIDNTFLPIIIPGGLGYTAGDSAGRRLKIWGGDAEDSPFQDSSPQASSPTSNTPTPIPKECTIVQELNLRTGPDILYDPPISRLNGGDKAEPVARNSNSTWVLVRQNTVQGWVNGSSIYINCNVNIASLPVGQYPPLSLAERDQGDEGGVLLTIHYNSIATTALYIWVEAFDEHIGTNDGDGMEEVYFEIYNSEGDDVYSHEEENFKYCAFGGNQPDCNILHFSENDFFWPGTGNRIEDGIHEVYIEGTALDGHSISEVIEIQIDIP